MSTQIVGMDILPLDIPLHTPFGIAGGTQAVAQNAFVRLRLANGIFGLGEAAPFPAVNGETRDQAIAAMRRAEPELLRHDATQPREASLFIGEVTADSPSARAALETAIFDAFTRHVGTNMWRYFGGAQAQLTTDITLPTGSPDEAERAATQALADGFQTLKVKVGGAAFDHDVARLRAVLAAAPRAQLILDANEALTVDSCVDMVAALGGERSRIVLLEQPVAAADHDGMRQVRERTGMAVAADESARCEQDVRDLSEAKAADVINLKVTKSGVYEVMYMIAAAREHDLRLMIGGMVETRLCMSVSACLAGGFGGFSFVDLDTPLFMVHEPVVGGYEQVGPTLDVKRIRRGHGVALRLGLV